MKITVLKSDLSEKLNTASRFTSARSQLPIIGNILLKATGAKLVLQATNLEMSVSTHIGAKVVEEGDITLPSRTFVDLINSISSNQIEIEVSQEKAKIITENVNTQISGVNSSDFPFIPDNITSDTIKISSEKVVETLNQVLFSSSPDDTRPALSGLLLDLGTVSSFITSDGFRLSKKDIKTPEITEKQRIILPKNVMGEIQKISKDSKENIEFKFSKEENQIIFKVEDYIISSRVVDGEYPNFEKIIPANSRVQVNISKGDLISSLKTIAVIARDGSNIAEFEFSIDGLKIKAENQKGGVGESFIPAKVNGGNISISFNYKYLIDFLNAINGDNVFVGLNDSTSSGVFREEGREDYLHLIMPVRV